MNTNDITTRTLYRLPLLLAGLLIVVLFAAACSDSAADDGAADEVTATMEMDEDADHDDADADHDDGDADHEEEDLFALDASETLVVEMQDIAFAPTELTVQAGEVIEVALQNTGGIDHDFTIEKIDATHGFHGPDQTAAGHDEHGDEFAMHRALVPGEDVTMRMRVHEPGTYEFYCSVPGHREAGMVGTLTVTQ